MRGAVNGSNRACQGPEKAQPAWKTELAEGRDVEASPGATSENDTCAQGRSTAAPARADATLPRPEEAQPTWEAEDLKHHQAQLRAARVRGDGQRQRLQAPRPNRAQPAWGAEDVRPSPGAFGERPACAEALNGSGSARRGRRTAAMRSRAGVGVAKHPRRRIGARRLSTKTVGVCVYAHQGRAGHGRLWSRADEGDGEASPGAKSKNGACARRRSTAASARAEADGGAADLRSRGCHRQAHSRRAARVHEDGQRQVCARRGRRGAQPASSAQSKGGARARRRSTASLRAPRPKRCAARLRSRAGKEGVKTSSRTKTKDGAGAWVGQRQRLCSPRPARGAAGGRLAKRMSSITARGVEERRVCTRSVISERLQRREGGRRRDGCAAGPREGAPPTKDAGRTACRGGRGPRGYRYASTMSRGSKSPSSPSP